MWERRHVPGSRLHAGGGEGRPDISLPHRLSGPDPLTQGPKIRTRVDTGSDPGKKTDTSFLSAESWVPEKSRNIQDPTQHPLTPRPEMVGRVIIEIGRGKNDEGPGDGSSGGTPTGRYRDGCLPRITYTDGEGVDKNYFDFFI